MSEIYNIQSLKELSDGDLALRGENISDIVENHDAFKGPTAVWAPTAKQIREEAQLVKQASNAARLDPSKDPERIAAREKLIQTIKHCCWCIAMYATYTNDPSQLDTIGVDRAQRATRSWAVKMPLKFHTFKVSHGKESGTVRFHVNGWDGKGSVEVQHCYGDPAREDSWAALKISSYCYFTHGGLEPARKAYFRARLQNSVGVGPWSDVAELIIL